MALAGQPGWRRACSGYWPCPAAEKKTKCAYETGLLSLQQRKRCMRERPRWAQLAGIGLLMGLLLALVGCDALAPATPTPTPVPTATAAPVPTRTPRPTATPAPTA